MSRWTGLAGLLATWLALSSAASAQTPTVVGDPPSESAFSPEQLEQMVAPVALYPDALLAQLMMAATYPLEIVEASRFMEKNPGLKGDALNAKLKEEDWDESVKSLCTLPDVLKQMNENLDWTQDLGDAFLAQRTALMDAVQRMRGKAYDAGNLKSSEQQIVTQQPDKIIVIESPSPEVVYVPSYSPTVVYGPTWVYPAPYYPAFYYPPPAGYGFVAFGTGVAVGAAIWGGCSWGWGHSEVDVDINRNGEFNRNTNANFNRTDIQNRRAQNGKGQWNHDPSHRKGVNYRDSNTASRFGGEGGQNRVSRDQARGYDRTQGRGGSASDRRARAPSTRDVGARPGGRDTGTRPSTGARGGRDSAFSGSGNAGLDRSASARGERSRSSSMRSSGGGSRGSARSGGMSRGGGGRRGGGGGRRR